MRMPYLCCLTPSTKSSTDVDRYPPTKIRNEWGRRLLRPLHLISSTLHPFLGFSPNVPPLAGPSHDWAWQGAHPSIQEPGQSQEIFDPLSPAADHLFLFLPFLLSPFFSPALNRRCCPPTIHPGFPEPLRHGRSSFAPGRLRLAR